MPLKIPNVPNLLFSNSRATSEGFGKIIKGQFDWSIHGSAFQPETHVYNTDAGNDVYYYEAGTESAGGSFDAVCPVVLPHGVSVITAAVYGTGGGETWTLKRITNAASATTVASGTVNTVQTTIDLPLIDNEQYSYFFSVKAVGDAIIKARITYDQ